MSDLEIRRATLDEILTLRHAVLRADGPLESALLPGDTAGDAEGEGAHWGAWLNGTLAACASLYAVRGADGSFSTQLRGMATAPTLRSQGLGGRLLEAVAADWESAREAAGPLWCNARIRAVPFYERHGFRSLGAPFNIPGIGEHLRMGYVGQSA